MHICREQYCIRKPLMCMISVCAMHYYYYARANMMGPLLPTKKNVKLKVESAWAKGGKHVCRWGWWAKPNHMERFLHSLFSGLVHFIYSTI